MPGTGCNLQPRAVPDTTLMVAFETSIQPFEDCCTIFVAKHPVTKPNLKVIHRSEEKLNEKIDQLVEEALASTEVIEIQ